jgi:hypothetical protein
VRNPLFIYLLLFLISASGFSRAQGSRQYYVVKDLKPEWLIYDDKSDLLVPFIPSVNRDSRVVHFYIDIDLYKDSYLQINYVPGTGVFINNHLADYSDRNETRNYSIDSLSEYFPGAPFFVSLSSRSDLTGAETRIVTPHDGIDPVMEDELMLPIHDVRYSKVLESIKLGVILIFILYAFFMNNNRRIFMEYYNISNTFIRVSVDEFLNRTAKITRIDMIYITGLSIVMSFITMMIIDYQDAAIGNFTAKSFTGFMWTWLVMILILFFWYLIRIFIISFISDIFQMREVKVIHTFELLRLTNFFSLVFFIMVSAGFFIFKMQSDTLGLILSRMLLLLAFFRMVVLFVKFLNSTTYKKLYLFAYLCIAEIIPVLVGLKLLLKSSFIENVM